MVDGFEPDDKGSIGFIESLQDGCRTEDSPFLKLSPPHGTVGVAFPWSTSLDHISSFKDSSLEGQEPADKKRDGFPEANLFAEKNGQQIDCNSEYGSLEGLQKRNGNLKNWGTSVHNLDRFREGDSKLEDWCPARNSPEGFGTESITLENWGAAGKKWGAIWSSYKSQGGSTVGDECLEEIAPQANNWERWRAGGRNLNRWEARDTNLESKSGKQSSEAGFMDLKGWGAQQAAPHCGRQYPIISGNMGNHATPTFRNARG